MLTRHRTIILIIKLLTMSELLKLNQVNLTYQTGDESIKVLKDIDLKTMKKETISFVGESGSGKTSLIMLIAGLEKATSGQIFFQNKEISSLSEDEVSEIRRKNIGIVFQSFYLIPNYTAVENVALTLELNNFKDPTNQAKEILERMRLKHRFNNLPSQLSGGEQQRVAIARSLANAPSILLADEPTGNLDSQTALIVINQLRKIVSQTKLTCLIVTHNIEIANLMDRKLKLDQRSIIE